MASAASTSAASTQPQSRPQLRTKILTILRCGTFNQFRRSQGGFDARSQTFYGHRERRAIEFHPVNFKSADRPQRLALPADGQAQRIAVAGVPGVTPFALGVLQLDRKAVSPAGEEVRVGQRQQMHADIAGDVALLVPLDLAGV